MQGKPCPRVPAETNASGSSVPMTLLPSILKHLGSKRPCLCTHGGVRGRTNLDEQQVKWLTWMCACVFRQ